MKVIIAGSRSISSVTFIEKAIISSTFSIEEIVSGTARGVDRLGEEYAASNNIPVKKFPANWDEFGKRAGYLRNKDMADYADALIAVWDNKSKGTKNMIDLMLKAGKPVWVEFVND